ncbi:HEAT repeat domain-containing protein [Microcoleus sp. FACHB-831]|uniref:HEAT repeat domain-containing protein n=1 Tax=Microcoleus sp. FACHB-831 TaxID=2692827 RepID=UPI001688D9DE|nr:HEAT repeat domain-containing protein [Microcoleus sp. FACHB-831]MBD1921382.1 HEAT repeat domain-containing protein [Microcoleus sp. FACHB-831]
MPKATYGPEVKARVKRLLEALLAFVNYEVEGCEGLELHFRWQGEDSANPQLVVETKLRVLEYLTQKDKYPGKLTTTQIRQAINHHLKKFLGIVEDNRAKTQGEEDWHFTLKLWGKDKEANLREFELDWERKRPDKSKKLEATFVETSSTSAPDNINWREVCETRLDNQKRLLNNPLTSNHVDFYVPLGLVEPKPKEEIRHGDDVSPEEGSRFYQLAETQITKTYNQPNEFFEQVLRQRQSKNSQGRRLAITGEPGAGKTTLCYQIAKWILEQNLGVPILIRLADIGSKTLGEFLLEGWLRDAAGTLKAAPSEYSTAFEELLKSGDVWLLLDGVDEMAVASPLAAINRQLAEGWANKVRVVLTCRLNVWDADKNALRDFDVYRNLDFDQKQVKEFIYQWFADNQQCEGLLRELAQSNQQRINDLVKNPLRLALLCRTWKNGSKLPDTKAGLYQRFVEAFYNLKDEFAIEPVQQQQLTQALGELALRALDGEDKDTKTGEVISRFRLRQCLVDRVFKERSDLLALALKLGWLNRVGLASAEEEDSDRAVYAFFHPTFQEYFAALAVDDWHFFLNHIPHNPDRGNYRIFEPHWKQVILLWLGRSDVERQQKEQFIQELVDFEDSCKAFYWYRAYFIAAAGIAEFKDCAKADEIVVLIIKLGFGHFNIEEQQWRTFLYPIVEGARAAVLQTNYAIAVNKLIDLLETAEDYDTRREAAESLGKIGTGNDGAIAALVRILESKEDYFTRSSAAEILGEIVTGTEAAIAALVRILESKEDYFTRSSAAEILGKIGSGNAIAIAALVRILETTEDDDTRSSAAEILGKIDPGNQAGIAALIRILETTKSDYTRRRAAGSLGEIGSGKQAAIAALVRILETTEHDSTPRIAAESLGKIGTGNDAAIAALVRILETTKDDFTRKSAAATLGAIGTGNDAAIAAFVRILETTKDDFTRKSAAATLGAIGTGNDAAIAALVRILETTEDDSTRWRAAATLGAIGSGNALAIAALARILETTEDDVTHWRAAESLGKIDPGNNAAIAAFVRILETTKDDSTRKSAAEILGAIGTGNDAAIAAFVRILETTKDNQTRWIAVDSLVAIGSGNTLAIAALIRILETTKDDDTRWRAAETLTKIGAGNDAVIAALVRIMETTEDDSTRWRAAETLGAIGSGNALAIAAFARIMETTDDDTRWRAAESLGKIGTGNDAAIAALVRILETTKDDDTRKSAAESLGKIGTGNDAAIAALVRILETTEDYFTRRSAAESLGKIGTGNDAVIAALVRILETTKDDDTRSSAAESLGKIVQNDQMPSVVSALQHCLTDEVYETNFDLYKNCYKVIWRCAQEMPYPKFYQAWHGSSFASHPEVPQTTGVGFTPSSLSLNLGELPELLHAAIDSNSELMGKMQLICIEGSKFENPDNPASEIYAEMVMQGCPERQNGEPETMQALKVYCQLKCQGVFLIFYEVATSELSQGFSPNFLKSLSKFNNVARICVVSSQADIPLQSFSPSQPNLVTDIVGWIREKLLED